MGAMSILADPPSGTTSPYTTLYATSPSWIRFAGAIAVPVCVVILSMIVDL